MRKIFGSLITIVALLGVGAVATGAYFQTTQSQSGFVLEAGSVALQVTPVAPPVPPSSPLKVGPGFEADACVKIKNTGGFPLNLTQTLTYVGDSDLGPHVSLGIVVGSTAATCSAAAGTPYALDQHYNNPQALGTLAVGGEIWVRESLRWIESGNDQTWLSGKMITLTGTLIGRTP